MTKIAIVVSPAFDREGRRRHGRFHVRLEDSPEIICKGTPQPLLDASRVLLTRGYDPSTVLCMVHAHVPTVVTLRAQIGVAAKFDVMGGAFVRRKPAAGHMPSSLKENGRSAEPYVTRKPKAHAGAPHKVSRQAAIPPSPTSSPASPPPPNSQKEK